MLNDLLPITCTSSCEHTVLPKFDSLYCYPVEELLRFLTIMGDSLNDDGVVDMILGPAARWLFLAGLIIAVIIAGGRGTSHSPPQGGTYQSCLT